MVNRRNVNLFLGGGWSSDRDEHIRLRLTSGRIGALGIQFICSFEKKKYLHMVA